MRKTPSWKFLAVSLFLLVVFLSATSTFGETIDLASGSVLIKDGSYSIDGGADIPNPSNSYLIAQSGGGSTANTITVQANVPVVTIQVNGIDITTSGLAFDVQTDSNVTLILQDSSVNTVRSGSGPGIQIGGTGSLTIQGETDNSGAIHAYGIEYSAAIGGPRGAAGGSLIINSGSVTAYGDYTSQDGAAIGHSSDGGTFSSITINGGIVTVTLIDFSVYGFGGPRCGDITINGGEVSGWGWWVPGMTTAADKNITISGGLVNIWSNWLSGITAGANGNIIISDGVVTASGGTYGAGIETQGGNLIISGGVVNAVKGVRDSIGGTLKLDGGILSVSNGDIDLSSMVTSIGDPSTIGGILKLWAGQTSVTMYGVVTGTFNLDLNNNLPGFINPVITAGLSPGGSFISYDSSFTLSKESDPTNTYWKLLQSSNADLTNLVLNSGALSPVFAPGTLIYSATVANSVASLNVTPTAAEAHATIQVNGTTVVSGSASGAIDLNVGENTISTVVTAQDGTTTKTYTVTVTRAPQLSSNADLSNLVLNSGALSPVFAPGTLIYSATVANSVASLNVTPTAAEAHATIQVNGTTVASGSASGAIDLNVGENTISTVVTAQDGATTKTYTVTVTRAPQLSSNADLSNLVLNSGALSPVFAPGTLIYSATVANSVASLNVTPTAAEAHATIQVNGTTAAFGSASGAIDLNVGENTISTVVTAQDGATTKTYIVTVTRAPQLSSNADLSNLVLNSGALSPVFAPGTLIVFRPR